MSFERFIEGDQRLPWPEAAAYWAELHQEVPDPVLTKEAALGYLKLNAIEKRAQDPEEALREQQRAALTDPSVVAALDHQELTAERQALQQAVQGLQQQIVQTQQQAQQADQQAQEQSMANQQMQAQVQQAQVDRQAAMEQAVASKDQALQEQVTSQQNREQLMQAADQLALQLKQVAAQPTQAEQTAVAQQQQMAEQQQQEQAAAEGGQPVSAKAQKEVTEAQKAQEEAAKQTQQAQDATAQDQSKQQQGGAAGGAPQAPTSGAPQAAKVSVSIPKQGGDRVAELIAALSGVTKEAGVGVQAAYAAGGAALGAGHAGLKHVLHTKKHGKNAPTNKEVDLANDYRAAVIKARRDPSYLNKVRASSVRYRYNLERSGREHPGGAMARGAMQGALIGGLGGQAIHSLGGRGKALIKAQMAAKKAVS